MAKFAKRHYEAIATAMQEACPDPSWDANKRAQWDVCVSRLADTFARDNGRFNRNRFIAACEPGANVKARTRYDFPITLIGDEGHAKAQSETVARLTRRRVHKHGGGF